ncbi:MULTISPECIES: Uma2 family endonuclease [Streptomyces]|uniref:Putative restriction endonuclease domain-containing protein n=1 Tax=Streptomyces luteosporeus TaxID=173856 RepID=A0ABP6G2J6_9ACTN
MPWPLDSLVKTFHAICKHQGGIKIDVVGDRIVISMRTGTHSETEHSIQEAVVAAGLPLERALCRVLIEFPGQAPRVPEVSILRGGSRHEPYSCEDLLAATEIVSTRHDEGDLALKEEQYARAAVPAFLIVDPFAGQCTLLSEPRDGKYTRREAFAYGETVPLRLPGGLVVGIPTDTFARRR